MEAKARAAAEAGWGTGRCPEEEVRPREVEATARMRVAAATTAVTRAVEASPRVIEVIVMMVVVTAVVVMVRMKAEKPTCTRYRQCKSCSGLGAGTGSCLLCLCYKIMVWAALAGLCRSGCCRQGTCPSAW